PSTNVSSGSCSRSPAACRNCVWPSAAIHRCISDTTAGPRILDPYAVGRWKTQWYVIGREHGADALRKFRIDRIEEGGSDQAAIASAGPADSYTIPAEFDAVDEMRLDPNDWGHDAAVIARVRVETDHIQNLQYELGGRVVERDNG